MIPKQRKKIIHLKKGILRSNINIKESSSLQKNVPQQYYCKYSTSLFSHLLTSIKLFF